MTKSTLQQQLETLSAARYPLHMPGHKRRVPPAPGLGCYAWDLTEIDGADDLHDADGILADAMARTAALYGARRCWYLVGGSTVGLLAGIRALDADKRPDLIWSPEAAAVRRISGSSTASASPALPRPAANP